MIIPRHKICDLCKQSVGVNKRYFNIKSKDYLVGYAGSCSDNKTHHICEDCMQKFAIYLRSKFEQEAKAEDELPKGEWVKMKDVQDVMAPMLRHFYNADDKDIECIIQEIEQKAYLIE